MRYSRQKYQAEQRVLTQLSESMLESTTSAVKLLSYLSGNATKVFAMLLGEFNSGLLTIRSKSMAINNASTIDEFIDDSGDVIDSPQMCA